jgi:GNAT superfamily N-acetyltransferase
MFKDHHYLSDSINKAARNYVCIWNDQVIGFLSTMTMPNGSIKNAWRGHRVVILPDFQGMGIGVRFVEGVAQIHLEEDHRFFSRTSHYRMGDYMDNSPKWKPTSKNKKLRKDINETNNKKFNNHEYDNKRICYSYEYIG